MRLRRCITLLVVSCPLLGNTQQLIPVIKEAGVLNTYLTTQDHEGCTYVSLEQVGAIVGGHLHWQRVAKQVNLAVGGHEVKFFFNSKKLLIDGQAQWLGHATMKDADGFWVPATFFATKRFFQLSQSRLQWPVTPPPPAARPEPAPIVVEEKVLTEKQAIASHAIRRIVIDPGHGGKDPGTVGAKGVEEKTLNLEMAQDLADLLRADDYEVLLTRTDDTFIPLAGRAKLANWQHADLFISIHCNASLSPNLKGSEVYFLSETASDPHADAVARAENASLELEGKGLPSQGQIQSLLRSLVKNANINESSAFGALISREVGRELRLNEMSVKQAGFYVLRGAEMPAVLIETGFLTNKSEEKKLLDDAYRKRLVRGIEAAVAAYDARKRADRTRG